MSIHFEKFGSGPALIVIHGLFGTLDNLKTVGKSLSDHFEVFLIDAPAHGKSSTPTPLDLQSMADMVITFIKQQHLSKVSLLGHSLGGKIAMEVALKEPTLITKLIVADIAPVKYTRRHDAIINGLQSVTVDTNNRRDADSKLKGYIQEPGVRGFLLKSFLPNASSPWAFDLDALAKNYDNLIDGNTNVTSPVDTLFIIGGESNYVTLEHKTAILSRFPNTRSKVIHGTGHWLHAEKPAAFEKICREFLVQS
ncbi:alpha/beta fold hydrolase [Psychrosphaera algicola]|uniref:Alpha/beta fold hydrolase n=1 Tax=Psychrosphaera algicola TaxID=3023714 RepID=A0ABT5FBE1_9GAMM|nr:alpha/beta fold hydrolase [Psychrosphaera sp. G1-22]MDC2887885.1 alpha/beta fold hydrolase [Psychrosphaera sp. G1-22]